MSFRDIRTLTLGQIQIELAYGDDGEPIPPKGTKASAQEKQLDAFCSARGVPPTDLLAVPTARLAAEMGVKEFDAETMRAGVTEYVVRRAFRFD